MRCSVRYTSTWCNLDERAREPSAGDYLPQGAPNCEARDAHYVCRPTLERCLRGGLTLRHGLLGNWSLSWWVVQRASKGSHATSCRLECGYVEVLKHGHYEIMGVEP